MLFESRGVPFPKSLEMNSTRVRQFLNDVKESRTDWQTTDLICIDLDYRLTVLSNLGLDYITLDRSASSLSCGEACRATLAAALGSRVTGTLIVVDEPSAGLAAEELPRVVQALRQLQSLRNSVVAVDHARSIVLAADHVIELGPGAGPLGGSLIYQGPPQQSPPAAISSSIETRQPIPITVTARRTSSETPAKVVAPSSRNRPLRLKKGRNITISINSKSSSPWGNCAWSPAPAVVAKRRLWHRSSTLRCVDDLGKSVRSHPKEIVKSLAEASWQKFCLIDQSPLTTSSRSNPATWLNVFDEIRQTFASTIDAKQRGFTAQQFSFNSAQGGRCRSCLGTGTTKLDMQFLPDVTMKCPECGGTRYRPEVLEVQYRGRSIADVLAMSVAEAATFFRSQPRIQSRVQFLQQIGLDYVVLGQPSDSLSGGEAQRLKLAARLIVSAAWRIADHLRRTDAGLARP